MQAVVLWLSITRFFTFNDIGLRLWTGYDARDLQNSSFPLDNLIKELTYNTVLPTDIMTNYENLALEDDVRLYYDKSIVINGVTVSSRKEYAHDFTGELFKHTSAIYLLVYKKIDEEGKIMQFLMDEQKNAGDRGLFSMVWKCIAGIFSASIDLAKRCMIQPFYRLIL